MGSMRNLTQSDRSVKSMEKKRGKKIEKPTIKKLFKSRTTYRTATGKKEKREDIVLKQ